jgi:hypothetical protein
MKIWPISNYSKMHSVFLVKVFLGNLWHLCSYWFNTSYIESLYYIPIKNHTQYACVENQSVFFNLKSSLL